MGNKKRDKENEPERGGTDERAGKKKNVEGRR
jgi:hypothetical protein